MLPNLISVLLTIEPELYFDHTEIKFAPPPPDSAGEYEVPYQGLVPPDPSFEEMKRCVVVERRQPTIPAWWGQDEVRI